MDSFKEITPEEYYFFSHTITFAVFKFQTAPKIIRLYFVLIDITNFYRIHTLGNIYNKRKQNSYCVKGHSLFQQEFSRNSNVTSSVVGPIKVNQKMAFFGFEKDFFRVFNNSLYVSTLGLLPYLSTKLNE